MSRVAHAVRRWVRLAIALGTLAVIAAPAAFGPAVGVMMRELGAGTSEHLCKCGMAPGKCGCPECDRLEQERRAERASHVLPVLNRHCDDNVPAIPSGVLPAGVLAERGTTILPVPRGERLPVGAAAASLSSCDDQPPTPPPRSASV